MKEWKNNGVINCQHILWLNYEDSRVELGRAHAFRLLILIYIILDKTKVTLGTVSTLITRATENNNSRWQKNKF